MLDFFFLLDDLLPLLPLFGYVGLNLRNGHTLHDPYISLIIVVVLRLIDIPQGFFLGTVIDVIIVIGLRLRYGELAIIYLLDYFIGQFGSLLLGYLY